MTYEEWKNGLVRDPDILGGTTVFPNSRLSVEHIGRMLIRGESVSAIKEDYPYLTIFDLEHSIKFVERLSMRPQ